MRRFRRFRSSYGGTRRRGNNFFKRFARKHTYGRFIPGAETKCVDLMDNYAVYFNSGANVAGFQCLNLALMGAGFWNRIGSRIRMKSIEVTIFPYMVAGVNPGLVGIYRIMLIYDSQPNGAVPGTGDLLQSTSIAGAFSTAATSPLNMTNKDRFLVLRDYAWTNQPAGPVGSAVNGQLTVARKPRRIHWYIKLRGMEAVYKANGGNMGDITTGAIHLVTICSDAGADANWSLVVSSRLRFMD